MPHADRLFDNEMVTLKHVCKALTPYNTKTELPFQSPPSDLEYNQRNYLLQYQKSTSNFRVQITDSIKTPNRLCSLLCSEDFDLFVWSIPAILNMLQLNLSETESAWNYYYLKKYKIK